jgi:hypothetical protein
MGFNPASLPGDVLDRVFKGLESQDGALVDRLGVKIPVSQLSGTMPTLPSVNNLGRPSDTGLSEGAEAKPFSAELSSVAYSLKKYVGMGSVPDGVKVELDALGMQTLSWYMQRAKAEQDVKINAYFDSVLKDTSLNLTQAAGTVWSDSSSTPIENIQSALRKCGKGDTIVLGDDVVDELSVHPDITARISNYSGGAASEGELLELFLRLFKSVKKVVLGTNLYNSANEGQSATIAYQFDGLAWVGHERDIVIPYMNTGNETEQEREAKKGATTVIATRRLDIKRPNRDTGCIITGI